MSRARPGYLPFFALVSAATALAQNQGPTGSDFVPLFNGKDLTGWRVGAEILDGKTESADKRFQVVDGVIVCNEGKGIKDLYTRASSARIST